MAMPIHRPSMPSVRQGAALLMAALSIVGCRLAVAADAATGPLKLLVTGDLRSADYAVATALAQALAHDLGQPAVVDAQGRDAVVSFKRSADEARALLLVPDTVLTLNPQSKRTPSMAIDDVAASWIVGEPVLVLACRTTSGIRSVADWKARQRDGRIRLGVLDDAAQTPLGLELARAGAGHVQASAYRTADALRDALGADELDCAVVPIRSVGPALQSQAVGAIAVTTSGPAPQLPAVPTIGASFGLELPSEAFVIALPAGIAAAKRDALAATLARALRDGGLRRALEREGLAPTAAEPTDARVELQRRAAQWAERLKAKR